MGSAPGKLVVISGPSGAGKTSVCRALKERPGVVFSVSATTRTMRDGEADGVDYRFMTEGEFEQAEKDGRFLESATYNGHRYGTLREPMEEALLRGEVFVVEIEVQGTRQLRDRAIEGVYVFIVPPDIDELRRRITDRGSNTQAEIEQRLAIAAEELNAHHLYDHVVVNADLPAAIDEVIRIIGL